MFFTNQIKTPIMILLHYTIDAINILFSFHTIYNCLFNFFKITLPLLNYICVMTYIMTNIFISKQHPVDILQCKKLKDIILNIDEVRHTCKKTESIINKWHVSCIIFPFCSTHSIILSYYRT